MATFDSMDWDDEDQVEESDDDNALKSIIMALNKVCGNSSVSFSCSLEL